MPFNVHDPSVKWGYVTHRLERSRIAGVRLLDGSETFGTFVVGRVVSIGKHSAIESDVGRRTSIFPGDVIVGAIGSRYATGQFEGVPDIEGPEGDILGIGGVFGRVVSKNERIKEPTIIEWIGALVDESDRALNMSDVRLAVEPLAPAPHVPMIVSLGAAMNSGKTTTAMQMIRSGVTSGLRVGAAKITGTACIKDPFLYRDAGAVKVYDFTDAGVPATSGLEPAELLRVSFDIRSALLAESPDLLVIEIADGLAQRETRHLLADASFLALVDGVTYAGPDALSCEAGVRHLTEYGYRVLATAGPVANSPLGRSESEEMTGIPCLDGQSILEGGVLAVLDHGARAA